jgi:hypothetical protein
LNNGRTKSANPYVVVLVLLILLLVAALRADIPTRVSDRQDTHSAWAAYEQELKKAAEDTANHKRMTGPESRSYAALKAFYAGDRHSLQQLYYSTVAEERARGDAGPLRQSDSILYLFNSSLASRDDFLLAQEKAAKQTESDELRIRILLSMLEDEYYEINQLKGQNKYNKFTRIFNRASSSLTKLALFQPQDAAQLLLDSVYSFRKAKTTTDRERKMVFLSKQFLSKYPNAPEAGEVRELLNQLEFKLNLDWAHREQETGKMYFERGEYVPAEFHLENAAVLNPSDLQSTQLLSQSRAARNQHEELSARARMVSNGESRLTAEQQKQLTEITYAMARGDGKTLENLARGNSSMASEAAYALSAKLEADGRHDAALQQLAWVSATFQGTAVSNAANGLLANGSYNLSWEFQKTVQDLKQKREKYVLTGNRSRDDSAYLYGSAGIQATGQAASGIPFLFVTDMLVRGVAEQFKTQLDIDDVVDAGAEYIRRYPETSRAKEIAYQVGLLSEKSGKGEESSHYFETADANTPQRRQKARENEARALMDKATTADDLVQRKKLLEKIVSDYSDLKLAETARKQLDKLQPTIAAGAIVLPRKMLQRDSQFVSMIGLPAALLDGSKSNGEISDTGIAIDPEMKTYSYRLKSGNMPLYGKIAAGSRQEIRMRAKALYKQYAYETSGKELVQRQKFPFGIEGGAGGSGVDLSPRILPIEDNPNDKNFKP